MSNNENSDKLTLEFTGERYIPGIPGRIELEHFHRYIFASSLVQRKQVLDIASGEGYGSEILARFASHVVGVDISEEAIHHARKKYKKSNLEFKQGSCDRIPLDDSSIDVVVSFETIEHHDQHDAMLEEIKRVLTPTGILIISNPEKYGYTDKLCVTNPHHIKELYRHEFEGLLTRFFRNIAFHGQSVVYGSAILREDGPSLTSTSDWPDDSLAQTPGMHRPLYLIAVASDSEIPLLSSSILEPLEFLNSVLATRDVQFSLIIKSLILRVPQEIKIVRVLQRIYKEGEIRKEHKEHLLGLARRILTKLHLP